MCPTRQTNRGSKPTVKTLVSDDTEKRFKNWNQPFREPDENEKRKLLVTALVIGMKHIMKNHVYNYVNVNKRQQKGSPIGLDLTGGIAQVYMIWWNRELKRRLTMLAIVL